MEPLMTLDGYRIIENDSESRELLNKFYEQKGITVISADQTSTRESDIPGSTHIHTGGQI